MDSSQELLTGADRKPVILVADDDEDLLLVLNMRLTSEGFKILSCVNGNGIFELVKEAKPDIIMLDITMDGISGASICKKLKSDPETKNIPTLMFSANHNIVQISNECGADDYVRKPLDLKDFKEKVEVILKQALN